MSIEQGKQISELYRRVNNMIRVGKVAEVDYKSARARVKIGKNTTDFLPWLVPSTAAWIPLQKDEQVVVLSPNGDLSFGMILPALYQSAKPAPSSDTAEIKIVANIAHTGDKKMTGTLHADGDITTAATMTADKDITAKGEVTGKGIALSTHAHGFQYVGAGQGATPQSGTTQKPS